MTSEQLNTTASLSAPHHWLSQATDTSGPRLRRRCALVVDDDEDSREALAMLLRWTGYDVHVAADGDSAIQEAAAYLPELIFLDISMPGRNGYDVCAELRRTPLLDHARIYAVSAISGETHDTRCSEAGFTAKLTKPIDPKRLEQLA